MNLGRVQPLFEKFLSHFSEKSYFSSSFNYSKKKIQYFIELNNLKFLNLYGENHFS